MSEEKLKEEEIRLRTSQDSELDIDNDESLMAGRISFAQKVVGETFDVLDVIGQGGMGSVYKVRDRNSGRIFALKLLKPDLCQDKSILKRFLTEAEALAELEHDNIIKVYDHGITQDGAPYLVMQFLTGETLAQHLEEKGSLPSQEVIDLSMQICGALQHAHKQKFVHRDIKPSNVILVQNEAASSPTVQLVDFGIAKILESPTASTTNLTQTGDVFGTPAYMSPEQCQGGTVDQRSDIYSFGCMLFEMLTGKQPFQGATPIQVAVKHINGEPERFADNLPDDHPLVSLEQVVLKCMRKKPEERYQSVGELIEDFNEIKRGKIVDNERSLLQEEADQAKQKGFVHSALTLSVRLVTGFVALILYCTIFVVLQNHENSIGNLLGSAIISVIGIMANLKAFFSSATHLRKRKTLAEWFETAWVFSIFASFLLLPLAAIPNLTPPLVDFFMCVVCGSCLLTWLLTPGYILSFTWQHLQAVDINLLKQLKKNHWHSNPALTKSKHTRKPMSWQRALPKIASVLALTIVFAMTGMRDLLSHAITAAFCDGFAARGAYLTEPLIIGAISLDPHNAEAYLKLGDFRTARGDRQGALAALTQGLNNNPDNGSLLLESGFLLLETGQLDRAISYFKRANSGADQLIGEGLARLALGQTVEASRLFQTALDKDKSTKFAKEEIYAFRGLARFADRDYSAAVKDFSMALELNPVDREADYVRRALCYEALGQSQAAMENYSKAAELEESEDGRVALVQAFAAKRLGRESKYQRLLKNAERDGVAPSELRSILLKDLPGVPLDW